MSDPSMIKAIKAAVTIPVMAKCRIGHFVEAQILEEVGIDYIDESEVSAHTCSLRADPSSPIFTLRLSFSGLAPHEPCLLTSPLLTSPLLTNPYHRPPLPSTSHPLISPHFPLLPGAHDGG